MKNRIEYLESKLPKMVKNNKGEKITVEEKYRNSFEKYASYLGNGVYNWRGVLSTDTAELFLMGVLKQEGIKFKEV